MSWSKFTPNGKGGFTAFHSNYRVDGIMVYILKGLLLIPIGMFIFFIAPAIILLSSILGPEEEHILNTKISIGASVLFFLDYCLGGILWNAFAQMGNLDTLHFFGAIQVGFLVIHIGLLFVLIYKIPLSYIPFLIICGVILYFGHDISLSIAENIVSDTPLWFFQEWYDEGIADLNK